MKKADEKKQFEVLYDIWEKNEYKDSTIESFVQNRSIFQLKQFCKVNEITFFINWELKYITDAIKMALVYKRGVIRRI